MWETILIYVDIYWPFAISLFGHVVVGMIAVTIATGKNAFDSDTDMGQHRNKLATIFVVVGFFVLYVCSLAFANMEYYYDGKDIIELVYWGSLGLSAIFLIFAYTKDIFRRIRELGFKGSVLWLLASFATAFLVSFMIKELGYSQEYTIAQVCTGGGVCVAARLMIG